MKVGTDWTISGSTVTASGMLADERYALGARLMTAGRHSFKFTIERVLYPDGHLFLGVAEATDDPFRARTWSFSPPTGNLYIGAELNEHGAEQTTHLLKDALETLLDRQPGAVVQVNVDMDARTLSFSVNGSEPVPAGVDLPKAGVRPWVFLYHEGDSVAMEFVT
jgi:hypothetical protein